MAVHLTARTREATPPAAGMLHHALVVGDTGIGSGPVGALTDEQDEKEHLHAPAGLATAQLVNVLLAWQSDSSC